ncbi:MAG: hypothetical protein WC455_04860 [Dehalococcoidia bacterium]|jgi:outer membrane lipoprotein-sorting protein
MKKFAVLGLIIVLGISMAAIGCGSGERSEPTPTPTPTATEEPGETGELPANYKFFMTWSDSDGNSGEMQYWVKGEKWNTAWSTTPAGSETETEMMLIYDGQSGYLYMPAMNQVYKYATSWEMANPGQQFSQQFQDDYYGDVSDETILAGFQAACSGGASIDGQETVNSIPCTKFTCNFAEGGVSNTWISDSSGWPVKVETTIDGKTTTVEYSNIEFNADIADSMFDINAMAPGVPIIEM